jgi:hypothetical protein
VLYSTVSTAKHRRNDHSLSDAAPRVSLVGGERGNIGPTRLRHQRRQQWKQIAYVSASSTCDKLFDSTPANEKSFGNDPNKISISSMYRSSYFLTMYSLVLLARRSPQLLIIWPHGPGTSCFRFLKANFVFHHPKTIRPAHQGEKHLQDPTHAQFPNSAPASGLVVHV